MTEVVLKVSIWGNDVAAVIWDKEEDYAILEFFSEFANLALDLAPLMMPLQDIRRGERLFFFPNHRSKTFKGLPGLIADSLPDDYGNQIIDEYFASKGLSGRNFNPLDRLCYVGKRGMGALEFEPVINEPELEKSSVVEISHLTELAKGIFENRKQFQIGLSNQEDQSLLDILKVGTSAGGAKPKAIIAVNKDFSEVRSGQVKAPPGFNYWLLKFDGLESQAASKNPIGIGRIEYAYYKMALDSGINMAESRLVEDGIYAHFMTKRFDRTDEGDRIHVQTLCALAHYDRDDRYSYEQAFQIMRRLNLPYPDIKQFYHRMVFNILSRNHDDHTKNHSFIYTKEGEWRLAPAYDLCYSYSSTGKWTQSHQMSANHKRENFTYNDLLLVGQNMGVKNPGIIIEQIREVIANWNGYARDAGVFDGHRLEIEKNLLKIEDLGTQI